MKIVFFGSSEFAVVSLKALYSSGHKPVCVITQPDKQRGRGLQITGTVIKTTASQYGLPTYQPADINAPEPAGFLKDMRPDLFVVIAYGQILSQEILGIPKILSVNLHASLLPKYRGAAPINWAIINAEKITGVTAVKMVQEMDAGPIISQRALDINSDDNAITLGDKLSDLAARVLLDTLVSIENNNYQLIPQAREGASFAPKLKKDNGRIVWDRTAEDIHNLIKGCIYWPGAFTHYKGKVFKIYKAEVERASGEVPGSPGKIIMASQEGIIVETGRGNLRIVELQLEGKKRMKAGEFIRGNKICSGELLS